MSGKEADLVYGEFLDTLNSENDKNSFTDIIIPSVLIAGLFLFNGIIFAIILKYRKGRDERTNDISELADL